MDRNRQDIDELLDHYNKWRQVHRNAGKFEPNEPDWEDGRLYFRNGYPYPDWSAYILRATDSLYEVLHASTERRNTPAESSQAVFSRVQDAGKFIVYEVADLLRSSLGLQPLARRWREAGLDPEVEKIVVSDKQARYELKSDQSAYFLAYSGGVQPFHRILLLTYDELDAELLEGFPDNVIAPLRNEKY